MGKIRIPPQSVSSDELGDKHQNRKEKFAEYKELAQRATYFSSDDDIHEAVDDLCSWFILCQKGEVDQRAYASVHQTFELKIKAALGMMHYLDDPASQDLIELNNYWVIPPLNLTNRGTELLRLLDKLRFPREYQGPSDVFLELDDKVCLFDREILLAKDKRKRTKQRAAGIATAKKRNDNTIRDQKMWEAAQAMKQDGVERDVIVFQLSRRYNLTPRRIRQILSKFEKAET